MIELFNKKKKPEGSDLDLLECYKDIDGNRWYEFKNMLSLPTRRAIAGEVATKWSSMNITKETLQKSIGAMKDFADKGKIVDMFHLLKELEFRLEYICEEKTLIDLACCYFILEGEDIKQMNSNWQDKKKEILDRDDDAKSFFLQKAWQYTTNYGNMSDKDIKDYLIRNKDQSDILLKLLQGMK